MMELNIKQTGTTNNIHADKSFYSNSTEIISTNDYAKRILLNAIPTESFNCFKYTLIATKELINRYCAISNTTLNTTNFRCLFSIALRLATKFLDDIYFDNNFFAKISGIPLADFNALELAFLEALNFDIYLSEAQLIQEEKKLSVRLKTTSNMLIKFFTAMQNTISKFRIHHHNKPAPASSSLLVITAAPAQRTTAGPSFFPRPLCRSTALTSPVQTLSDHDIISPISMKHPMLANQFIDSPDVSKEAHDPALAPEVIKHLRIPKKKGRNLRVTTRFIDSAALSDKEYASPLTAEMTERLLIPKKKNFRLPSDVHFIESPDIADKEREAALIQPCLLPRR